MRRRISRNVLLPLLLMSSLLACSAPEATPTPSPSETASATPRPSATSSATAEPTPTPTPPPLSLEAPTEEDERQIEVALNPELGAAAGRLRLTVTNLSEERIEEIVLRWPTELDAQLRLTPNTSPVEDQPLIYPWSKWVVGPGASGEPAGTTSLGWGPVAPGASVTIDLRAARSDMEAFAFDIQLLAGEALLQTADDEPAQLRVEVAAGEG